jgi:ribosome-binding protein aMBF1 (putative translation factor)
VVKTNVLSLFQTVRSSLSGMQRIASELSDSFAAVVEKRRKQKRLSRAALAAQAGLHQTYIGLLERGESKFGHCPCHCDKLGDFSFSNDS